MNWDELKAAEERKREAAYNPQMRWLHIQQTITWAESVMPYHLRWNRPRTRPEHVANSTPGAEDTAKRESPADSERK